MIKEIKYLLKKELLLEYKQKYAFSGLMLYVVATVFICYLSFKQIIDPPTWNALFWIIMLFAAINAVAKSFMSESRGRQLYMYTIASPQAVIFSKIIYNILLLLVLAALNLFFYSLFIGNIVEDMPMFILGMILGSCCFASVLTMVSAIASRAGSNTTLMAILSMPVLIPLLITIIRISKNAMDGLDASISFSPILIIVSLNVMVVMLSYILFPYLWRE